MSKKMQLSSKGLNLIKQFEGFRLKPYRCPGNVVTIGYGSTKDIAGMPLRMDRPEISIEDATMLLQRDCDFFVKRVNKLTHVRLTQNMFDALVSFTYNLGCGAFQRSTLRMKLNRGDYESAANEFRKWNRAGGSRLRGLVRRRETERNLFLVGAEELLGSDNEDD